MNIYTKNYRLFYKTHIENKTTIAASHWLNNRKTTVNQNIVNAFLYRLLQSQ